MRFETGLFIVIALIMYNVYTEGKYIKLLMENKKYIQMAGIAFAGLAIYYVIKRQPARAGEILTASNEYLKYMPVDRNASSILNPILDFTSSSYSGAGAAAAATGANVLKLFSGGGGGGGRNEQNALNRMANSTGNLVGDRGLQRYKRSVSEAKKKFVAAKQGWKCAKCGELLSYRFEVDHIVRLEFGGSNELSNLSALCSNCHSDKTGLENVMKSSGL